MALRCGRCCPWLPLMARGRLTALHPALPSIPGCSMRRTSWMRGSCRTRMLRRCLVLASSIPGSIFSLPRSERAASLAACDGAGRSKTLRDIETFKSGETIKPVGWRIMRPSWCCVSSTTISPGGSGHQGWLVTIRMRCRPGNAIIRMRCWSRSCSSGTSIASGSVFAVLARTGCGDPRRSALLCRPRQRRCLESSHPVSIAADGCLREQSGVPPDYFSATGQLWGTPVYSWGRHRRTGFRWWRDRLKRQWALVDQLRLDHFRALASYWSVPGRDDTAMQGRWRRSPGAELLALLRRDAGGGCHWWLKIWV